MPNFNQSSNQSTQNQQANATNYVASNLRVMQYQYGRLVSKYLGVTRVMNKETFIATAYNNGSISRIPQTIYLGTYDREEEAARAYDLVTLKLAGPSARLNFPLKDYPKAIENMAHMSIEDLVSYIRRASAAARGNSRFRGVFRNAETGKWQARIAEAGKECFFGAYETEEEAAVAFDVACIREKGYQAITNFNLRCYDIRSIFNTTRMQQQATNANRMRQQAMQLQAINARKIWLQAMELQAINARTLQLKAKEVEARRRFLAQQQQCEADPLRLTLATGHTSLEKPTARHLSLTGQTQQTEGLKDYFKSWALQTARRELASASNKNFKHGEFSPFCSYREMKLSEKTLKVFDIFAGQGEGICMPTVDKWLEAQGMGSQHVSSSVFKQYKNDPDIKGKAKVIYDV